MTTTTRRGRALAIVALAAAALVAGTSGTAAATPRGWTSDVRLIAFNDFHGNLEPPSGSSGRITLSDGKTVDAGGAAYLATHLKNLRSQARDSILLSAGDNIGGSPAVSALFHDEPTIEFLNSLDVKASAIGNHELDEGYEELKRMIRGGCHPKDGCQFRKSFKGAKFPMLAANMTFEKTGVPALMPFSIEFSGLMPIGIIGVPLKDLPTVVSAEAVKGLKFEDEVKAIDRTANLLDRLGVKAQVVLLHQGDNTEGGGPNDCKTTPGPARDIAQRASAKVDAIFTGHSHQQYVCSINDPSGKPRPVLQGASFGRILSVVDAKIDWWTRDIIRSTVKPFNQVVTRDVPEDRATKALVEEAKTKAAPIAGRKIGTISADIMRAAAPSGESQLGNMIADAQLESTKSAGAQIALMNPGGVRADLVFKGPEGDGVVTYGEAYTVQPFANILQTVSLTGAQIKTVLEQQFQTGPDGAAIMRILQPSSTLKYTWTASAPKGSRISGITVAGQPVQDSTKYRVTVNNFLQGGGDGFTELSKGTELTGGAIDLDSFIDYLAKNPNAAPPATDRITAK
ncbi:bifunctional UDP-sugar hydrolase/5'-nucleotidase [Allokutzneria sp. NRRL B-24872]|uniref:bifunctional metallophosphatase/5'-nucleotidase n=1 Tax=Allokutzneria sp. NRRL B-24872 TaxID=1137961 RepID=UPI000A3ADDE2|nr:bifunctional metallophosphatase/5'-nucleotidase [Allokutzneria sp. NRRL B-24872]